MKFDSRLLPIYAAMAAAMIVARNGLTRYCWIMFGTFWGFTWGEPVTKVEWSDADD